MRKIHPTGENGVWRETSELSSSVAETLGGWGGSGGTLSLSTITSEFTLPEAVTGVALVS